jgi:hypothetical protein
MVHDFLPKWMIFFHLPFWWLRDLYVIKIAFSVDRLHQRQIVMMRLYLAFMESHLIFKEISKLVEGLGNRYPLMKWCMTFYQIG